jgi:hypothetical protein
MATRKILSHIMLRVWFLPMLTSHKHFSVEKTRIYVKIDIIFWISIENWVDLYLIQLFLRIFIFIEKFICTPPQGTFKKWFLSKSSFCSPVFCYFTSTIILQVRALDFIQRIAFSREVIFCRYPEVEYMWIFR